MTEEKPKEIFFSDLPLDLKKHFVYHLSNNNVDFEQLKNTRFMHAKVKIIEKDGTPRLLINPETSKNASASTQNMFKKKKKSELSHKDCIYSPWEHKRRENNENLQKALK